ncbi:MAG: phosphotransferase [Methylococcales bacterium]|nr:phosphotransferase [Methylococcales bacterium]
MNNHFKALTLKVTGAKKLVKIETIQSLWSGYGEIVRYGLEGSDYKTVVVKHVSLPDETQHPRGWNTDLSHQRKIKSYHVEMAWYQQWSQQCSTMCQVPHCLAVESRQDEMFILLEDLDSSGFPVRHSQVSEKEVKTCLSWLASFHAIFMHQQPENLWEEGTYWHLKTRPDEWQALQDKPLKKSAAAIDQILRDSPFQTFVHGDAKLANFCFATDGERVAAVDFQYVGGGCGMKDVAYFIGSCLDEKQCQQQETKLLDYYFDALKKAIAIHHKMIDPNDVEKDWRPLYPIAWTDFHRFIKGWSPGHWKINSYSEQIARDVISQSSKSARK